MNRTMSRWLFCVYTSLRVCFTNADDLCTNQWEVTVEGLNSSELVVHHSSVSAPGRLTHLVWKWRGTTGDIPSAHVWFTQHARRDILEGGFTLEPLALFPPAPRLWWAVEGVGGGLRLGGRGDSQPLATYPPWQVTICEARLTWGINADKQLYVVYGDVNISRSLEEGWNMETRLKRQAEFPAVIEAPPNNGTNTSWWRRLVTKLSESTDGKSNSWASDLIALAVKLFVSVLGNFGGKPSQNIPNDPDAEFIPSRFQAAEIISDDT